MGTSVNFALCIGTICAFLAGCGGSPAPIGPSVTMSPGADRGWLSARARTGKGLVYVSDGSYDNAVYIFDKKHLKQGLVGEITADLDEPGGLAVDSTGALYVANYNDTVTVYPRGQTTPSATYSEGIAHPMGLAVAQDTGRLYVANFGALDVTEYRKGSITPDKTVYFNIYEGNAPYGVAVNRVDELYVAALGYPDAQAYKLPLHQDWLKDLGIRHIVVMHGIAVDRKNDVLISNQVTRAIDVYPPHSHKPSKIIASRELMQPMMIALDETEGKLYVPDAGYISKEGSRLLVFSYPQGKLLTEIHVHGAAIGVAISPP